MYNILLSESINEDKLQEYASSLLEKLEDPNILSIKKSNRSIVVRVDKLDNLEEIYKKLSESVGEEYTFEGKDTGVVHLRKKNELGKVSIYFRQKLNSKNVVILKNIIAFLLINKSTDTLKDRLNLNQDATDTDIMDTISEKHESIYDIAVFAKKLIKDKIPNISDVKISNTKADLIIEDEDGNKYGINIKASPKSVVSGNSMSLGFGNEEESLIHNSVPWFEEARKLFISKVKRTSKMKGQPTLRKLIKAKQENPQIYKQVLNTINATIRKTFLTKLRRLNPSKLASFVNDYRMGNEEERNGYKSFFRLTYDRRGVTLDRIGKGKLDREKIKTTGLTPSKVVKEVEGNIKIDIPNSQPLVIRSIGISNFLTDDKELLKVKTK